MTAVFVVARNPEPASTLPYLLRLPLPEGPLLLKARHPDRAALGLPNGCDADSGGGRVLKELSVTQQRYQAVLEVLPEELPAVEVAKQYGVTRQSVRHDPDWERWRESRPHSRRRSRRVRTGGRRRRPARRAHARGSGSRGGSSTCSSRARQAAWVSGSGCSSSAKATATRLPSGPGSARRSCMSRSSSATAFRRRRRLLSRGRTAQ